VQQSIIFASKWKLHFIPAFRQHTTWWEGKFERSLRIGNLPPPPKPSSEQVVEENELKLESRLPWRRDGTGAKTTPFSRPHIGDRATGYVFKTSSLSLPFASLSLSVSLILCALYLPAWFHITEPTLSAMEGGTKKKNENESQAQTTVGAFILDPFSTYSHIYSSTMSVSTNPWPLSAFSTKFLTKENVHIRMCSLAPIQQVQVSDFHIKSIQRVGWYSSNAPDFILWGSRFECLPSMRFIAIFLSIIGQMLGYYRKISLSLLC
jgi:hypothetical protein